MVARRGLGRREWREAGGHFVRHALRVGAWIVVAFGKTAWARDNGRSGGSFYALPGSGSQAEVDMSTIGDATCPQSTAAIHSPATSYIPESRGAGWQLPGMQLPELLLLLLLMLPLPACIQTPCLCTGMQQASALI